jgi:hypothetical protein
MRWTSWVAASVLAGLSLVVCAPAGAIVGAGADGAHPSRNKPCGIAVISLQNVWAGADTWAAERQGSGDGLVFVMRPVLGQNDPVSVAVLALAKQDAKDEADAVTQYQAEGLPDTLRQVTSLGNDLRRALPAKHHKYVASRIAKIRSLYKEYWDGLFAPAYLAAFQALAVGDIAGWSAQTAGLTSKQSEATSMFWKLSKRMPYLC